MAKLYIFAIGGTGSRVLRSLTFLMASGVSLGKNIDSVVPIIIDPDEANGDLTRTALLMRDYSKIRSYLNFTGLRSKFFSTSINGLLKNYTLPIEGTHDKPFKKFIGLHSMGRENQAMMEMLFSNENLEANMQVGFKGNPNIGSVVLNQVVNSADFQKFANDFKTGDKIFIISSIFGGTGASGFPLLVTTMRQNNTLPNFDSINNAEIGAVTLLPYFKVNNDENSAIDSSTFISKSKAALAYYEKNVASQGVVNALYYLGDDDKVPNYPNNEGSAAQQNRGHIIEMLSATAIIDFCNSTFDQGSTINKELSTAHEESNGSVSIQCLGPGLTRMLRRPLTQMMLMSNYMDFHFSYLYKLDLIHNFGNGFFDSEEMVSIRKFTSEFRSWIKEMSDNQRSLDLFDLDCKDNPFILVKGVPEKPWKGIHTFAKKGYELFDDRLNRAAKSVKTDTDCVRLMEIFDIATSEICQNKLKI